MIVFIGGETSGALRRAFQALGVETYSADLLPSEDGGEEMAYSADNRPLGRHLVGDMFDTLANMGATDLWPELAIFHPTCTLHTGSAAWAFGDGPYHQKVKPGTLVGAARREAREKEEADVRRILALEIRLKAIENPVGTLSSRVLGKPTQIVQPYQFGEDASKRTCWWLYGPLPQLRGTRYIEPRIIDGKPRWANQTDSGQNRLSPGPDRWKERSRTLPGPARAIAAQWSAALTW